jgi:hypothetical protein
MLPLRSVLQIGIAVLASLVVSACPVSAQTDALSADQIVARAVERAKQQLETQAELDFESTILTTTEHLNGDLEVEKTELATHRQYALEGVLYEELIAREGEPLDEDDARDEVERREDFVEDVRERVEKGKDPEPEDENRVDFDEEFVGRYRFTIEGEENVNGHSSWILYMEPRSEDLPVRRDIDNALNKSTGRLWIAQDDYGVARVEFEMAESVRFWGGILGTLRNTIGRMEFTRVADGVWLPDSIDIQIDLRILFRNIRRRFVREWDEYVPAHIAD